MSEELDIRIHGGSDLPTLIYLPGLHGDWTLISRFRAALAGRVRLVEVAYPQRVDWSLADLGRGIIEQLVARGITHGWLLGESFGSQVAWAIVDQTEPSMAERGSPDPQAPRPIEDAADRETRAPARSTSPSTNDFAPEGIILVGGFVRHCSETAVRIARECSSRVPFGILRMIFGLYGRYVQFRYRGCPETVASIKEFVARRTEESDRLAMTHRYDLIIQNDLRPVARRATLPVFCLCAMFDHLVPWLFVLPWLKNNCPGFRGARIIFCATHNTLASAPKTSADQIVKWMAWMSDQQQASRVRI